LLSNYCVIIIHGNIIII